MQTTFCRQQGREYSALPDQHESVVYDRDQLLIINVVPP